MSLNKTLGYDVEAEFPHFFEQLQKQSPAEWQWLFDMFRTRVVPYLYKIDGNLPADAIASVDEFIEEIFANSLTQFYESFAKGSFASLAELRGLMFRIAEFKLKEGYHKVRRDKKIYFTENLFSEGIVQKQDELSLQEIADQEIIAELRVQVDLLKPADRDILLRYARGEELGSIALNLGMDAAACRKRKQRAINKLKILMMNALRRE